MLIKNNFAQQMANKKHLLCKTQMDTDQSLGSKVVLVPTIPAGYPPTAAAIPRRLTRSRHRLHGTLSTHIGLAVHTTKLEL